MIETHSLLTYRWLLTGRCTGIMILGGEQKRIKDAKREQWRVKYLGVRVTTPLYPLCSEKNREKSPRGRTHYAHWRLVYPLMRCTQTMNHLLPMLWLSAVMKYSSRTTEFQCMDPSDQNWWLHFAEYSKPASKLFIVKPGIDWKPSALLWFFAKGISMKWHLADRCVVVSRALLEKPTFIVDIQRVPIIGVQTGIEVARQIIVKMFIYDFTA